MIRGSRRGALGLAAAAAAWLGLAAAASAQATGPLQVRLETGSGGWGAPAQARVRLSATAHLAIFEIRPGHGAVMLWPPARHEAGRLPAGRHALALTGSRFGFPDERGLPVPGFPVPGRIRHLFRPYLLAVAARRPLWLAGHYHGQLFQPRQVFPSVGTTVNALLQEVLPHPRRVRWSFDLVPAFPARFGPYDPYGPYRPYDSLDPRGGFPR